MWVGDRRGCVVRGWGPPGRGYRGGVSLRSISSRDSQRPRTITPARFVVFRMSTSGSASSRTMSALLPRSIVPVSRSVPK